MPTVPTGPHESGSVAPVGPGRPERTVTPAGIPPGGESAVPGAGPDERRQLTVMFTDLVGSTDLASSMDPEDWHQILDAYQHVVAQLVTDHGGVVSQFQGDGVVAYFGYPQAVETAGADALDAGLAVVAAVAELSRNLPPSVPQVGLQARAGVHTGVAVVASSRAGGVSRRADLLARYRTWRPGCRVQPVRARSWPAMSPSPWRPGCSSWKPFPS